MTLDQEAAMRLTYILGSHPYTRSDFAPNFIEVAKSLVEDPDFKNPQIRKRTLYSWIGDDHFADVLADAGINPMTVTVGQARDAIKEYIDQL
jgi:hypothetical protein